MATPDQRPEGFDPDGLIGVPKHPVTITTADPSDLIGVPKTTSTVTAEPTSNPKPAANGELQDQDWVIVDDGPAKDIFLDNLAKVVMVLGKQVVDEHGKLLVQPNRNAPSSERADYERRLKMGNTRESIRLLLSGISADGTRRTEHTTEARFLKKTATPRQEPTIRAQVPPKKRAKKSNEKGNAQNGNFAYPIQEKRKKERGDHHEDDDDFRPIRRRRGEK
ncbi:MAG: hypothetical protein AB7J40_01260 [Candidatus Altimarinota bacterium]